MQVNLTRYEEMMSFLPWYYQDSKIMQGIMHGDAEEVEAIRADIMFIFSQFYIDTATESGVSMWEKELGITPISGATLELRKAQLKAKLQRPAIMTPKQIQSIANLFTKSGGAVVTEVPGSYHFQLSIPFGDLLWPAQMKEALKEAKPAHLGYDICYTLYGDLVDEERVSDSGKDGHDDFWAASLFSLSDDVPYGIPIKADKHDGALIRGGTICRKAERIRDGTLARCGFDATAASRWRRHIDYIFRSDGKAARDGTLQHDGRLMRCGEKPWEIEYPAQMEEFSVLLITLAREGAATFEDTLDDYLPRNSIAKRDGNGRHGPTSHPVDSGGGLTITRARQRNGRIRRDGGDINLHDGSIRRDGLFYRNGGGIKRRIDVIHDTVSGGRGIKRPRKEAPLRLRYPELDDVCEAVRETASMTAMAGGFRLIHDGSLIRSGKTTHDRGGNTHGISRQCKAL